MRNAIICVLVQNLDYLRLLCFNTVLQSYLTNVEIHDTTIAMNTTEKTIKLSFNPSQKTKVLLGALPNERSLDILVRRYGLGGQKDIETLESIGSTYGITRERVRQIENNALKSIQKSENYIKIADNLRELANLIEQSGGVIPENELIQMLACTEKTKKHILFLLSVGDKFKKRKETPEFTTHWYTDEAHAHSIREGLRLLTRELKKDLALPEEEMVEMCVHKLSTKPKKQKGREVPLRWLKLSKKIDKNPLGEWGLADSPSIRVKGIRDFAYLTLKRHGSPMHFSEVAITIQDLFAKKAHSATTHNELIKDPRFVLVGRGIYALKEWGYSSGLVRDIITNLLKSEGALTKQKIIERVKRERYVKDNTIAVNLQDTNFFSKLDDGTYTLL